MEVREFVDTDWRQVWSIVREVVRAKETFPYNPAMTEGEARTIWVELPPGLTVVAALGDSILGTAKRGPNQSGPGSHISTASFMVAADARGQDVGTELCRFALSWARTQGYAGMQFNTVAESNLPALDLNDRLGFQVVGTVPVPSSTRRRAASDSTSCTEHSDPFRQLNTSWASRLPAPPRPGSHLTPRPRRRSRRLRSS